MILQESQIIESNNFVTLEELIHLKNVANIANYRSTLVQHEYGKNEVDMNYMPASSAFYGDQSLFVKVALDAVKHKIASALNIDKRRIEDLRITRYLDGQFFKPHNDCNIDTANDRQFSAILYIQSPSFGGGTNFPSLNKYLKCEERKLVLWNNLNNLGGCNPNMIHEGETSKGATKYILITFIRKFNL